MKEPRSEALVVYTVMALAAILWTVLFHQFYSGVIGLFPDGYSYFHWTKFYFDSIANGTYPLWNPFVNWGFPVGFKIRFLGEFNPLLLIAFIPYKLGLSYVTAYFLYAVGYFMLGMFGFYLICRRLLPGRWWACFGFVLLLFSNLGIAIFFNYCEVVLLVPGIWFFYFWLRFHAEPSRAPFLGMIFCAMLILVSYMPFYFMTVFGVLVLVCLLLYVRDLGRLFGAYGHFIKSHPVLIGVSIMLLVVAAVPGYVTYQETSSSEFSYAHRQADSEQSAVTTGIGMVNAGSILGPLTVRGLFSGLRFADNYLSYFFLSVIIYPILLIGLFQPLTRRLLVCFAVAAVMLLITFTDATPVLGLLYKHVFYFKLIRNIFYLFYLAVPFIVLYALLQWQAWWRSALAKSTWAQLWVSSCCAVFLVGLLSLGDVLLSQYVSVGALWLLVMLRLRGQFDQREWLFWLLLIIVSVLQPVDVYRHYLHNVAGERRSEYTRGPQRTVFYYQRPRNGQSPVFPEDVIPDTAGYLKKKYAGTAPSAQLQQSIPADALSTYTQHKLLVYEGVAVIDPQQIQWGAVRKTLTNVASPAIVFDKTAGSGGAAANQPNVLRGDTERLQVNAFNLNSIALQTNFKQRKFLVYNDSYHSGWHAKINGKSVPLYQTNIAFKGLWLEPGANTITLRYGSRWLELFYFALTGIFAIVFIVVIVWERQQRQAADG